MDHSRKYANVGIANFVVIIFVIVACVGFITSYILAGKVLAVKEKVKDKVTEKKQLDDTKGKFKQMVTEMSPYLIDIERFGVDVKVEDVRKLLDEKAKAYSLVSKIDRLEEIGGEDLTLEYILGILGRRVMATKLGEQLADYGKNSADQRIRKFSDLDGKTEKIKDAELGEIRAKRDEISGKQLTEEAAYRGWENQLNAKATELDNLRQSKDEEFRKQQSRLDYDINKIKQEIEFLSTKEIINRDIIETQGRIIKPAVNDWYAFINLGTNDNIKLGMKFRVFRRDKNGARKWKGLVEVKKSFDTYSQVSINGVNNPFDPILEGDYITNVFYSRGKQKYVALIGSIERKDFKYDKNEIERRLTELGVKAELQVSLKTDFAILGKNYELEQGEVEIEGNKLTKYETIRLLNIPYLEGQEAIENIEFCLGD